jgi:hypothetical protein
MMMLCSNGAQGLILLQTVSVGVSYNSHNIFGRAPGYKNVER